MRNTPYGVRHVIEPDCVAESVGLAKSLAIDDWLYFPDMGGAFFFDVLASLFTRSMN